MKHLDVGHLGLFLGQQFDAAVFAALEGAGFGGVRASHGYVIQRLLEAPQTAGALSRELGISPQAVTKQLNELAALEMVEDAPAGDDARERRVQLSKRGRACVQLSRSTRAKVTRKLETALGEKRLGALAAALSEALHALGGLEAVQRRRVRPPRAR